MPRYQYRCKKCFFEFEEVQSIHADALEKCPKCDGSVQRIIGRNVGIAFKGSGFYVTDSTAKSKTTSS